MTIGRFVTSVVALLAIAVVTVATPSRAAACSCMAPPPPLEALEGSTHVFEARVTEVDREPPPRPPDPNAAGLGSPGGVAVTVDVVRTWKGADHETMLIWTSPSSAACGYHFEVGESYLVYAQGEGPGMARTGLCSRTRKISEARDDLSALGAGVVPVDVPPPSDEGDEGADDQGVVGGDGETPGAAPAPDEPPAHGGCAGCALDGGGAPGSLGVFALALGLVPRRRRLRPR